MLSICSNIVDDSQECWVDGIKLALASCDQSMDRYDKEIGICTSKVGNTNILRQGFLSFKLLVQALSEICLYTQCL